MTPSWEVAKACWGCHTWAIAGQGHWLYCFLIRVETAVTGAPCVTTQCPKCHKA